MEHGPGSKGAESDLYKCPQKDKYLRELATAVRRMRLFGTYISGEAGN
jgi:hypothetical protein